MKTVFKIIVILLVAIAIIYLVYGLYRASAQGLDATSLSANTSVQLSTTNTDGGFCSDAEEAFHHTDPTNRYDDLFQSPPFDGKMTVADILGVVKHFGTKPGGPNYYPAFDRGPGYTAPDGSSVNVSDILMAVNQFGNSCTNIPWCGGVVHELVDEPTNVPDGTTSSETCYAVRDASGVIVDYLISNDDSSKISTGQVAGMPGDVAGQQGLPTPTGGGSAGGSPYIQYETCTKQKKWRDIFHYNYYTIKVEADYKILKDAGIYTDLVNVISDTGDQTTNWPWDLNGSPDQWKVWYYTGTGPWDGKIIVHRDVPVRSSIVPGITSQTKTLRGTMTIGPGDSCQWHASD